MDYYKKFENLKILLSDIGSAVVAYSGGVDSTFLLKVSNDVMDNVLAVIGKSHSYPAREYNEAMRIADLLDVQYQTVVTEELEDNNYSSNPVNRCYYCKSELFNKLLLLAKKQGYRYVIEGSNVDDEKDYRPGMKAICDLGIRSPLKESGLTKDDIRKLSKEMGVPTWDKPSMPCLSSRFPYGTRITKESLQMIEQAEQYLFDLGIKQFRVRYHGNLARIEVFKDEMEYIIKSDISTKIVDRFKEIGFVYISLDLQGYRMGSMNEILNKDKGYVSM